MQLTHLQSAIGDVHDWHVFAASVDAGNDRKLKPPHFALGVAARSREWASIAALNTTWFARPQQRNGIQEGGSAGAAALLQHAEDTIAALFNNNTPTTTANSSHSTPFQPGVEVERRWLLTAMPAVPLVDGVRVLYVEGGYIPGHAIMERLRRTVECRATGETAAASGACRAYTCSGACGVDQAHHPLPPPPSPPGCACVHTFTRTLKAGEGVSRLEAEEEVTAPLFEALWPATRGHRLCKRRLVVPVTEHRAGWEGEGEGGRRLVWEVDVVLSCSNSSSAAGWVGTVILEVELPSVETPVPAFPAWLGPYVQDGEVTDTFNSAMLAGVARE